MKRSFVDTWIGTHWCWGDGMSIRFDATNVRIYFYDEPSYDRVDGLHVNVNHEELPVFEYAGMPPSEAAKKYGTE